MKKLISTRYNFAIGFNESVTKYEPTVEVILSTVEARLVTVGVNFVIGEEVDEFRFLLGRESLDSLIENLTERRKELHKMEKLSSAMSAVMEGES